MHDQTAMYRLSSGYSSKISACTIFVSVFMIISKSDYALVVFELLMWV